MGSKHKRRMTTSARLSALKVKEEVGAAELGTEQSVRDETLGRDVSMLLLHADALPNSKSRRSFTRHLESLARLDHPTISTPLDGGTNNGDGRGFVISEPLKGRSMAALIEDGARPVDEALTLTLDVLNGLSHAHHHGILHGGLSAKNVFVVAVKSVRRARLRAFGFPSVVGEVTKTSFGELRVDAEFAAPEVLKNEPVDPRADVYSAGVLLFMLLTGRHPIPVTGKDDPFLRRLNERADALPQGAVKDEALGKRLRDALRVALAKNPAKRFSSARAFALALTGQDAEEPDPWAWPEPCPEGGTCAASAATIPPLAEREWSRKSSDRPFRCRVTGKDYAGAAQWDARALSSRGARHKEIPLSEGEAPADVELSAAAPEPAAAKAEAPAPSESSPAEAETAAATEAAAASPSKPPETDEIDRKAALRALLEGDKRLGWLEDEGDEPAPKRKPSRREVSEDDLVDDDSGDEDEAEEKKDMKETGRKSRLSDSNAEEVTSAFLDAWADARRNTDQATSRMRQISTRQIARDKVFKQEEEQDGDESDQEQEGSARTGAASAEKEDESVATERPSSRPMARTSTELNRGGVAEDVTPWKFGLVAAVLVLMFGIFKFDQDHKAFEAAKVKQQEGSDKVLADVRTTLERTHESVAALQDSERLLKQQLAASQGSLKAEKRARAQTQTKLDEQTQAAEAAKRRAAALEAERDAAKQATQSALADLAKTREALQAAKELDARNQVRLAAAQSSIAAITSELAAARKENEETQASLARAAQKELDLRKDLVRLGEAVRAKAKLTEELEQQLSAITITAKRETDAHAKAERERAAIAEQLKAAREAEALARRSLAQAQAVGRALDSKNTDLLMELSELEVEREQLDEEALTLEGWLRESEREARALRTGQHEPFKATGLSATGEAKGAPELRPNERSVLLRLPLARVKAWLDNASQGNALLAVHVKLSSGVLQTVRGQTLSATQLARPPVGGRAHTPESLGEGRYRFWVTAEDAAAYARAATGDATHLTFTLHAGPSGGAVKSASLANSVLTPDSRDRVQAIKPSPLR